MSSHDVLQRMFGHMAWADSRTLSALSSMNEAPPQAIDLYAHILTAEHVWLRRIENQPAAYEVWQSLTLEECERLARANHTGFASVLSASDRDRVVAYKTTSGVSRESSLDDILVHLSHHGMYHRGQVALLIRASGGAPIATDYILYQWDQQSAV